MRSLIRRWFRSRLLGSIPEWTGEDLALSALVFAPHQDDEVLGCGGTVIRKRQAQSRVKIVFLTDGSRSHAGLMAEEELRALRVEEALAAAVTLGVDKGDVSFLAFPDGQLTQNQESGIERVAEIIQREKPAQVFIPYYLDGPPDHLATTRIVVNALRRCGHDAAIYEYPVWFWFHWPWVYLSGSGRQALRNIKHGLSVYRSLRNDFRSCVEVAGVLERKRTALEQHKSQVQRLVPDPKWQTLGDVSGGEFLDCFYQGREIFHRYRLVDKPADYLA
jgi:LmbE family N-acetylglucosaminyl deacetylase